MRSIFRIDDDAVRKLKRNTFDLSFQNNVTLKFGKLVPVFCKEVLPGDSFKIEPTFGLRYLPQVFPVQTRQRCSLKYYYVRNRNLWNGWMDFIGKTKSGFPSPYLKFSGRDRHLLTTSSLADYLGVPTKISASHDMVHIGDPDYFEGTNIAYVPNSSTIYGRDYSQNGLIKTLSNIEASLGYYLNKINVPLNYVYGAEYADSALPFARYRTDSALSTALSVQSSNMGNRTLYFNLFRIPITVGSGRLIYSNNSDIQQSYAIVRVKSGIDVIVPFQSVYNVSSSITYKIWNGDWVDVTEEVSSVVGAVTIPIGTHTLNDVKPVTFQGVARLTHNPNLTWSDLAYGVGQGFFPFCNDVNPDGIRISALAFRAVQSIYNALIRNAENNPLILDGQPEYNKYITSDEGGAVSPSDLLVDYHANWSDDRFTTSLPSPQQGNAPLVGLTGTTNATFVIGNEDGSQSTIKLVVGDNGEVQGVVDSQSDAPADLVSEMWNAVDYGISINDLRNVNAYQRWKENNIRVGYKYRDQISAHYGVTVRFDVLDMPEFIGGITRDVSVTQVTQTTQNDQGNLGDIAGQSGVYGDGHSVTQYCDEHGFIIGLMCVTPTPMYQDALPKYLLKSDPFDYYFPEFGKIGPQPITNKELSFSTSVLEGVQDELFGYQRAWYDYFESLDEVHGLFRTDFRPFILARDFTITPTLGRDFLTVDSEDLNNIFYSLDDKDKILGQVYHKVTAKRLLPLYGIPSIE